MFCRRSSAAGRPLKITTGNRLSTRSYAPGIGRLNRYFSATSATVTDPMAAKASIATANCTAATRWMILHP